MAYDQLMQTYLGVGLLADRPAAPNVKAGVGAFYYATDTPALYVWDGATWHALAGGAGASSLLAVRAYAAGGDGAYSTTSTSFVDVDATNQYVSFTAPPSGAVLVRVTGAFAASDNLHNVYVDLRETGADIAATSRVAAVDSSSFLTHISFVFAISGLVPGTSHTYTLGYRTGNSATAAQLWTGPALGPTTYEVWDVG